MGSKEKWAEAKEKWAEALDEKADLYASEACGSLARSTRKSADRLREQAADLRKGRR